MTADGAREHFEAVVARAVAGLRGGETLLAGISGEVSDFTRFNHAAVRQAGTVRQQYLSLDLIEGARHAAGSVSLTGSMAIDGPRVDALLVDLREMRGIVPDDPHLLHSTADTTSERFVDGRLPDAADVVEQVAAGAHDRDLVGIYAAGDTFRGFASSYGQRNWFAARTFNLDWSLHLAGDKATKSLYAGLEWDDAALARRIRRSVEQLDVLGRAPIALAPGDHRSYLAPEALVELLQMVAWDGFGIRAHRSAQTSLLRMVTDGARLHPDVRLVDDVAGGIAPDFQSAGFPRRPEVVLIDGGGFGEHLVSPRSAREYGVETTGADNAEQPVSLAMAPGSIPADDVLAALGTGLFIGNLWYLNFSDRAGCRTTGMTRFGTFWVEGGEIVAPVDVLRFDDTAYHMLGDRLEGLTDQAETILDSSTYGSRSTDSWRVPGALVDALTFTL